MQTKVESDFDLAEYFLLSSLGPAEGPRHVTILKSFSRVLHWFSIATETACRSQAEHHLVIPYRTLTNKLVRESLPKKPYPIHFNTAFHSTAGEMEERAGRCCWRRGPLVRPGVRESRFSEGGRRYIGSSRGEPRNRSSSPFALCCTPHFPVSALDST